MELQIMKLIHKLTIERSTNTRGTTGQVVQSWATHLTRFGLIRSLTSRELLNQTTQIQNEYTHEVTLRTPIDIKSTDRIKYGNRVFEITGPLPVDGIGLSRFVKVLCKERE